MKKELGELETIMKSCGLTLSALSRITGTPYSQLYHLTNRWRERSDWDAMEKEYNALVNKLYRLKAEQNKIFEIKNRHKTK
jgi:predicted transcriptional regulator